MTIFLKITLKYKGKEFKHAEVGCCGLTSHSAILQLYSDGTVVQFPNFDLLSGTQHHGQLGVFSVPSLPDTGTGTSEDVFNLLAIRGPIHVEGKPGIEPGSSDPQSSPLPLRHRGGLKQRREDMSSALSISYLLVRPRQTTLPLFQMTRY